MRSQVGALTNFLMALDGLLAAHHEALRDRSVVTLTRRPGLLTVTEADANAGSRPVLIVHADTRDPEAFGRRIEVDEA